MNLKISTNKIAELLEQPESATLDFKESFYDFKNDKDLRNTAKFVKDVISFSNTIRNEIGYIIFGVKENADKSFDYTGMNSSFDDAILQEKVKDKVYPRPHFSYYELEYKKKKMGVLEFPVSKYEFPLAPAVKMKGLEVGKIYYRNGTSNTEANGMEAIRINDWLKSLPGNIGLTLADKIAEALKRLTLGKEKLSVILADLLDLSRIHNLKELELFCSAQITGVKISEDSKQHKYRMQRVFISLSNIEINPFGFGELTTDIIKTEMEKHEDFHYFNMLFNQSIVSIEESLSNFKVNKTYATLKKNSNEIFGKGDYDVNVFFFDSHIRAVYNNIKQKTIDELMKIQPLKDG